MLPSLVDTFLLFIMVVVVVVLVFVVVLSLSLLVNIYVSWEFVGCIS